MKQKIEPSLEQPLPSPPPPPPPPSIFVKIQGKPGTGKTFVTKTLQNITCNLTKSNGRDAGSAPTGCAASLFGGKKHHRSFNIQTGREFNKAPTNRNSKECVEMESWKEVWSEIFTYLMDEDSMTARALWAWAQHRASEARTPSRVLADDFVTILFQEESKIPESIYNRPWGGIPIIYSFGDCHQLSAIGRSIIDMVSPGKSNSADAIGRLTFADFLSPPNTEDALGVTVIMDKILRQDDEEFLSFLDHIRNGEVNDEDVEFILSRCLEKMPMEERKVVDREAIHLCPTWSMRHKITYDYLLSFNFPVAVVKSKLDSMKTNCSRHLNGDLPCGRYEE